jgi:hypothetical protein
MLVYSARGNDIVLRWYTHTFRWYGLVYFVSGFMSCYRWVCKRNNGAWKKIKSYKLKINLTRIDVCLNYTWNSSSYVTENNLLLLYNNEALNAVCGNNRHTKLKKRSKMRSFSMLQQVVHRSTLTMELWKVNTDTQDHITRSEFETTEDQIRQS